QRLDQRSHLAIDPENHIRRSLVTPEVRPDDDEIGTEPDGSRHRHRRVHAEHTPLVARSGDPASFVGVTSHGNQPPPKRRVVVLLDRRVERIHVDVENPPHNSSLTRAGTSCADRTRADTREASSPVSSRSSQMRVTPHRPAGTISWYQLHATCTQPSGFTRSR